MKFDDLLRLFGDKAWFDFEMVHLMSGEDASCVHTELYRWRQAGKLIELRRGMFVMAEPWRRKEFDAAALAGAIYAPSCLSGAWALIRAGVLAETPAAPSTSEKSRPTFTSVTARPARVFANECGHYLYACLPACLLFGYATENLEGGATRIALPEKALLDYCLVEGGEWDVDRFAMMGMSPRPLNLDRLEEFASRARRPRLARAVKAFRRYAAKKGEAAAL